MPAKPEDKCHNCGHERQAHKSACTYSSESEPVCGCKKFDEGLISATTIAGNTG